MTGNTAHGLSTATALFFTWSLLTFFVRLWVKLKKAESWGWDDTTISVALVLIVGQIASTFWAINSGYGLSLTDIVATSREPVEQALFAGQILYVLSVGFTKISTACFVVRLTRKGQRIKLAYGFAVLCAAWTVVSALVVALRGNLAKPWEELDGSQSLFARWIAIEAVGILIEVALWALSISLVWGLNMKLEKRLLVLGIFSARLLLFPLLVLRLLYLSPSQNPDATASSVTGAIYTQAVLEYSFMSASITCLKPFLRPLHSGYTMSSVGGVSSHAHSGTGKNSRDPYYILSAVSRTDKDGTVLTTEDSRPPTSIGKEAGAHTSYIGSSSSTRGKHDSNLTSGNGTRSLKGNEPEPMVISKTQAWSVRYEEGKDDSPLAPHTVSI